MQSVAKNTFTAVLVLDVNDAGFPDLLLTMREMVEDKLLPVRFGIILVASEQGAPDAGDAVRYHFGPDSSFARSAALRSVFFFFFTKKEERERGIQRGQKFRQEKEPKRSHWRSGTVAILQMTLLGTSWGFLDCFIHSNFFLSHQRRLAGYAARDHGSCCAYPRLLGSIGGQQRERVLVALFAVPCLARRTFSTNRQKEKDEEEEEDNE